MVDTWSKQLKVVTKWCQPVLTTGYNPSTGVNGGHSEYALQLHPCGLEQLHGVVQLYLFLPSSFLLHLISLQSAVNLQSSSQQTSSQAVNLQHSKLQQCSSLQQCSKLQQCSSLRQCNRLQQCSRLQQCNSLQQCSRLRQNSCQQNTVAGYSRETVSLQNSSQ